MFAVAEWRGMDVDMRNPELAAENFSEEVLEDIGLVIFTVEPLNSVGLDVAEIFTDEPL